MNAISLKRLWSQEKEAYKKTEVGSGTQSFTKKMFESEDIFNLKEGKLSTKLENRQNEFIYEKPTKEKRKADFYIYITSEIAIPVEVEKHQNIKAGEVQLLTYQKDFEKHYGILTDGYEWRFYNNNLYKTYTLDEILDYTDLFLTFWKEYVKPEFYYLSFFQKEGQLALVEEVKLRVEDYRQLFFEDITRLIQLFKNKLEIEKYLGDEPDSKVRAKHAIELTYAYIIQFVLYKTLVDNDFDDFHKEFEITVIKIHESLKEKRYKDILGVIEGISSKISKNVYRPFTKEQDFIKDKIQDLYHSLENNLSDVSPWLDIFVFIKKYNFSDVKNEIFGYIYENYLKELYEEGKKGQYFTDPAVVNFMLEQIGYTSENVNKSYEQDEESVSIIDPSCGSGTFLYSAANSIIKAFRDGGNESDSKKIEEIVTNNIFGLDIEEFPLYLAEMNILMRMLPLIINEKYNNPIDKKIKVFKTVDSIAEFMDTALRNTWSDHDIAYDKAARKVGSSNQIPMFTQKLDLGYLSYVRDEDDLIEMKRSLENQTQISRRRFDYVVGNPPYISYNECSKQKILIFEYMKQGKAKLNDIYGINLHSTPMRQKKYAPKPNFYTFFIALGLALLKEGGKLCYIIPQTILTAGELDVVRYHLSKFTTIERIVTFGGKMFLGRGLKQNKPVATSSLILLISRKHPRNLHEIEILNYYGSDSDLTNTFSNINEGKMLRRRKVLQNKLFQNIENWNFITKDNIFLDIYETYVGLSNGISIYYNHLLASNEFGDKFYFDGSFNIPTKDILREKPDNQDYWEIPRLVSPGFRVKTGGFYSKNNKIKIAQGSQGEIMLKTRYKIIWNYINPNKFFFIEGENIFPRFQQFCIASNNKREIFYLLSLLNSSTISYILNGLLMNENEKDRLVGLSAIKEFIKIPRITVANKHLKENIIDLTQQLLNLEKTTLDDLVDFSKVLKQKFDMVYVDKNKLVVEKDSEKIELPISKDFLLVNKIIEKNYGTRELNLDEKSISLNELSSLPIIDFEKQKEIKDIIDDLVFCLYFNIGIPKDKTADAKFVKSLCEKHKFYKLVDKI